MQKYLNLFVTLGLAGITSCSKSVTQPVHDDKPFVQDYSIKYYADTLSQDLTQSVSDKNGVIKIASRQGLMQPHNGRFQYPGTIAPDQSYRFIKDKKIAAISTYENQFIYLTDAVIFANAWAGKVFIAHTLPKARIFEGGKNFSFLISDGSAIQLLQEGQTPWTGTLPADTVLEIRFNPTDGQFWVLGKKTLSVFDPVSKTLKNRFDGSGFTSFDLYNKNTVAVIGTTDGYLEYDLVNQKQVGEIRRKIPVTHITSVRLVNNKLWFGTVDGAFALRPDGKYDYYNGERWLPGNHVKQITQGPANSVLFLTNAGLGQLHFTEMTLEKKAMVYEEQVRKRHIRNGFNATVRGMDHGNLSTGFMEDSDNDGLWTSMYLGAEIFRYAVTKDSAALQNCRESMEAMERLYSVNPVPGFPARSFERSGHINELGDPQFWQQSVEKEWVWKSTTSSDEAIGHIFAFGAMAELIEDPDLKNRAIIMIDTLMSHIVKNDMYMIDYNGKPTLWGKWNPAYVNAFPENVGDRKLNSSNIIAMLQTAYHFTKKEKYKEKAFELMNKHGYLENLMRAMELIGKAPEDADAHAKHMSDGWNHSDDEMYFLGYWGLYRYAFNDTLKAKYKESILDHWRAERPEKEGAWNIFTAVTGTNTFDLNEAVWYLQRHPLDMIDWRIRNSHRKDIEKIEPNFRKQTIKEVLPASERPIQRHNGNTFNLDRNNSNGTSAQSAGDIWLLPYWLGRYLGVIGAPLNK
jgi:hypothetical protein